MEKPAVTDKRFPLCSYLGVLRKTSSGRTLVISTSTLNAAVGWKTYQGFLPHMEHTREAGYVTPASCETWLRSLGLLSAVIAAQRLKRPADTPTIEFKRA